MTFIKQITSAYEAELAEQKADTDANNLRVEGRIKEELDKMGVTRALIIGNIAKIEGVTLRGSSDNNAVGYGWKWQVRGDCPECFHICWSEPQRDLAGIGEMHAEFKPGYGHICPLAKADTAEARLLDVLKDVIIEMMGGE